MSHAMTDVVPSAKDIYPPEDERVEKITAYQPEKAILAAYLTVMGHDTTSIASHIGMTRQTIWKWRKEDWWPAAIKIAQDRWLDHLEADTRNALREHVKNDPKTARWAAEKLVDELKPKRRESSSPGVIIVTSSQNRDDWEVRASKQQKALAEMEEEDDVIDVE